MQVWYALIFISIHGVHTSTSTLEPPIEMVWSTEEACNLFIAEQYNAFEELLKDNPYELQELYLSGVCIPRNGESTL